MRQFCCLVPNVRRFNRLHDHSLTAKISCRVRFRGAAERYSAPEKIQTSDLCLRRAAQCKFLALAVTAILPKTPRKRSISHERHEAGYRL